jgi:formate/nitrite transporter FocA (FNT family)
MRIDKIFMSGVMAGMMLSFACASVLSTNTAPWFQENAPGLIRTIAALIFPYGLCMIILTGSDLCTGSFLVCRTSYDSHAAVLLLVLNKVVHYRCCTSSPSFHS